jgi:hypothetical protein
MKPSTPTARIAALTTNASEFGSIRVSMRAVSIVKAYQLGAEHLCEAVHKEIERSAAAATPPSGPAAPTVKENTAVDGIEALLQTLASRNRPESATETMG